MIGIPGVQAMSEVQGRTPKNNMLLLASRKHQAQIHWTAVSLSLILLSSQESQHYLSFPEEEKEAQRWKRMHRSQSQCPKGSTACSSRIWDEQTRHRPETLTAESAIWLKTRLGWGIPDSAVRWNLKGTSNQGPWVCRKRTPSSLCLVSYCSGWEATGSSLQASQRCDFQRET